MIFAKTASFQRYKAEYLYSSSILLCKGLKNRGLKCYRFNLWKTEYMLNIDNMILILNLQVIYKSHEKIIS